MNNRDMDISRIAKIKSIIILYKHCSLAIVDDQSYSTFKLAAEVMKTVTSKMKP